MPPAGRTVPSTPGTWKQHSISRAQVMQRMAPVETGAPELWPFVLEVIEECVAMGYLAA